MASFNYFRQTEVISVGSSSLPDPSGPLSKIVPSTSIEEANKEVAAQNANSREKKHSPYMIVSLDQKAIVGKYAANHGTTRTICHFAKDMPNLKAFWNFWKSLNRNLLTSFNLNPHFHPLMVRTFFDLFWNKSWIGKCESTCTHFMKLEVLSTHQ